MKKVKAIIFDYGRTLYDHDSGQLTYVIHELKDLLSIL